MKNEIGIDVSKGTPNFEKIDIASLGSTSKWGAAEKMWETHFKNGNIKREDLKNNPFDTWGSNRGYNKVYNILASYIH